MYAAILYFKRYRRYIREGIIVCVCVCVCREREIFKCGCPHFFKCGHVIKPYDLLVCLH